MITFIRLGRHRLHGIRSLHFTNALDKLVHYKLSDIGEGIAEVQVKEWHVKVGDKVSEFDNICEVQSDKAAVTITSRYEGIVKKLHYNIDDVAKVGAPLVDIEVEAEAAETAESKKEEVKTTASSKPEEESQEHSHSAKYLATPAVRRLIREHNVNIRQIMGTGRDGRVLKEDVLKHLGLIEAADGHEVVQTAKITTEISTKPSPQPSLKPLAEDKIVPIRGYTRAMISSMSEALKIPHFGYADEFNVNELVRMRQSLQHESKNRGIRLTYMPVIIKATSAALLEFPQLNASADAKQENMIYHASHNICLAMDTPGGLVVPNIKNCEQKTIWDIAADLSRIQEAGKRQRIARDDLLHGTFTLSNIGILGGTYCDPVIFPPQVAIGAVGKIRRLPRFDHEDKVVAQHTLNIGWAADHRYVDGATMARFSNRVKEFLENPWALIASLR